ncbi:zinc-dependent alcohol dehydrogenase family protein [Bradyrhizobium elkanii]|uniref:zinc-dependent alcohol dehydrogenase family protein n=2 Tax=Bradyrhizobium elkanii TaxID=29448 RepID=UPI0020A0C14A|nr:zinc-dependent alcohol dehydrogenase family protein [Bradyrhizobium elkanii]MCP1972727.1 NADPH:quinone reductase-like Zn-dependent oxidoreductase [Bradyrhizobium elkanii]MCS3519923.1 NADPH:quinone reductase-like Zn-dependent oxidoreductase [Bradyrhizobium elkanii]MCS4067578.1 NADPH:quinone reductase-like Zn-dependent oxidoreductase [Bradyrhizobium elkanii]MCS4083114.1 NADPH:quinone reductase-like Zn-dependent oxidoreductase [Bradyrhizobium elkanii]MCS4105765.1 NADPH:quinone reductase-like Z
MKAVQVVAFGRAADVVKLNEVPDVGSPGPDEVVVAVEAAPINNSDFMIIAGRYGYLPSPPATLGIEGVGRVVATGSQVRNLKEGDRTLIPFTVPSWTERVKFTASWQRALPDNADVQQLSMIGVNPATAYLLLTDFVKVPRGGWVIQNGANSATARAVIAIAKSLGLKTVNIVRREDVVDEVKSVGGDIVLLDGPDLAKRVARETGRAPIQLALDMVGGSSALNLMNCLAPKSVLVIYSAMSGQPFSGSALSVIFNEVSVRGFWLGHWGKTATDEALAGMYDHLVPMVASGAISAPVVGTYRLEDFSQAIAQASAFKGKVIFTPS